MRNGMWTCALLAACGVLGASAWTWAGSDAGTTRHRADTAVAKADRPTSKLPKDFMVIGRPKKDGDRDDERARPQRRAPVEREPARRSLPEPEETTIDVAPPVTPRFPVAPPPARPTEPQRTPPRPETESPELPASPEAPELIVPARPEETLAFPRPATPDAATPKPSARRSAPIDEPAMIEPTPGPVVDLGAGPLNEEEVLADLEGATALPAPAARELPNVMDALIERRRFHRLMGVLHVAARVQALRSAEEVTLLAPDDAAFAELPQEKLVALLSDPAAVTRWVDAHVLPGRVTIAQIETALDAADAGTPGEAGGGSRLGGTLALTPDQRRVLEASRVVRPDGEASNGMLHVIDHVTVFESLASTPTSSR